MMMMMMMIIIIIIIIIIIRNVDISNLICVLLVQIYCLFYKCKVITFFNYIYIYIYIVDIN